MPTPADVAEALKDLLNSAPGGTFAQAFTAARSNAPGFPLEDLASLRVITAPKALEESIATRGSVAETIRVDVGVIKRFASQAEADALLTLAGQIRSYVRMRPLASVGAAWLGTAQDPLYDPDQYRQNKVFFAVLTITYRL
jgi:hypothetical protein